MYSNRNLFETDSLASKQFRNFSQQLRIRHRGGGVKRHTRLVDFRLDDVESATVTALEYDPNRSAHLAL
ncbi:MAG: hypothetical protein KTQ13_13360, partial [Ferruginibacter sp.]|nr:hypothetical protein [Ferruginibacter sp.]